MKIELECKVPLTDRDAVGKRLETAGARRHGAVFEQNWVFDRDGELSARREVFRLRVIDHAAGGLVTHKRPAGKNPETAYKTREETEFTVDNAENARAVFAALGFSSAWYYEKRRETWEFAGCEVVLDTLPGLGDFLEIEAPDYETLDARLRDLGLERSQSVAKSYATLWREHCAARGQEFCAMRF